MAATLKSWSDFGARLAAARKAARLTQAELAAAVDLERTAITKIEAGERKLDSLQLARVARVLRRPIDWFVVCSPPAVTSKRKSREAVEESQADVLLEGLARDATLLIELNLLKPPKLARPRPIEDVDSAEAAARGLRRSLGIGPGAVWDLLSLADAAGLYALSTDLQDESLDGSYVRLETAGVALVNGGRQTGRRRFTLVHELGHHVFADDYSPEWIVGTDGDDRERLINAFVIHFLMPREAVLARWQECDGRRDPRLAAIVLGAEFGVSWTAALGHLCNLQLIDAKTRQRLEGDRPTRADYLEGGIVLREELVPPVISPRFAQAVVRGFKRHKLSAARALELLRGTIAAADLPPEDKVPRESMRAQFDLD